MKYYKHMSDMSTDVRIKRLIRNYGIEGYGLYVYLLELIVRRLETESPIPELEEDAHDIASDMGMDTVRVEEIIKYAVSQDLFSYNAVTGRIVADKIYKYLEQSATRSEHIRKMISAYKTGSESLITVSQTVPDKSEEQNRTEQNRTEHRGTYHGKQININTLNALLEQYGKTVVDDYFQRISDYCDAHGKQYKDYAATCRNWLKRDKVPTVKSEATEFKGVDGMDELLRRTYG